MKSSTKMRIKHILGPEIVNVLKNTIQEGKYIRDYICGYEGRICTSHDYKVYSIDGQHVFFGYYDLHQANASNKYLLAHVLPIGAMMGTADIKIGYIDREKGGITTFTNSKAWNWQQGSRLRWHPVFEDEVLFNDYSEGTYITKVWNLKQKCVVEQYPYAFYDINKDFSYGISLNFSRLQRLRPGYGYSNKVDTTVGDYAPKEDGLFLFDIAKMNSTMVISLYDLACQANSLDYQNYINHVAFSPDGFHFLFFHIYTGDTNFSWKTRLMVGNTNCQSWCLLDDIVVSHYCWLNSKTILVTSIDGDYYLLDLDGKKVALDNPHLKNDGHPSVDYNNHTILCDTYPLKHNYQKLFFTNMEGQLYKEVAQIYSDPRMYGEYRCDLHPRLSREGNILTVDATHVGRRCVIEFSV